MQCISALPFEFCDQSPLSFLCILCRRIEIFNLFLPLNLNHQKYCSEVRANDHDQKLNLTIFKHQKGFLILAHPHFENWKGNLCQVLKVIYKWSVTWFIGDSFSERDHFRGILEAGDSHSQGLKLIVTERAAAAN